MEAECGFTAAVNEMLMQSWGGKIRVFPAMPEGWKEASFRDLRAEGGFLVSAEMREGEVVRVEVRSEKGGEAEVVWASGRAQVKLGAGERRELAVR